MLEVQKLSYRYHGGPAVLEEVSFSLERGHFLAILGNNGVGKSTLLKCLAKVLKSPQGAFLLDGEDVFAMSQRKRAQSLAFVSQKVPEAKMTVHDVVMLGRRPYMQWNFTEEDHRIVHQAMRRMQLEGLRGRFLTELSGGERQKVMLARALAQETDLLLLDEPTSSLDIYNQYEVLQLVQDFCREDGLTAILVIHDLNLALRFCDRFLLLQEGKVYACGDWTILTPQALRDVYGVEAKLVEVEGQRLVLVADREAGLGCRLEKRKEVV